MNVTVAVLVGVLALWMLACGWSGFARQPRRFALIALAGLALNHVWMVWGLQARPLGANALMAQSAALIYALCAFATGWVLGRFLRHWKSTRADRPGI